MTDQQRRAESPESPRNQIATLLSRLRRRRRLPTLGFQLLLVVNGVMAILLAVLLTLDYRRELSDRLEQKRIALQEEAKTMLPAVSRLRSGGAEAVQQYLDAVCGRMRDTDSPGHHIAVDTGDTVIQAMAHGRSSRKAFQRMQQALFAQQNVGMGESDLVVGSANAGGVVVYVSEDAMPLRRGVQAQTLWRLMGIFTLGIVAAVITSVVLLRIVAKPVSRFVRAVTAISQDDLGVEVSGAKSRELAALGVAIEDMSKRLQSNAEQRRAEMEKAREIQEHLLPVSAAVPGMPLAALYRPAADVAGDYYDVLPLSDGSWILCIADVSGHGVPAAMSAAMLKTLLLNAAEHHIAPGELLEFINSRFTPLSPPDLFASMLLVRWEPQRGRVQFASAGHEPGLLLHADDTVTELGATGFLLGIDSDAMWSTEEFFPREGDRLLATTDGVAEAWSPQGELFGRERLQTLVQGSRAASVEETVNRLNAALLEHQGASAATDDTTVLAVEFPAGTDLMNAAGRSPQMAGASSGTARAQWGVEQEMMH